jgi:hypothetical protein
MVPDPAAQVSAAKVPPFNFEGCWSGTVEDVGGSGTGFIDFVQHKKHITHDSSAELSIPAGEGSAPVTGNVKRNTFKLQHFGHHCKVAFKGGLDTGSGDIVGTYATSKRCFNDGVKHSGSFDFAPAGSC